MSETTHTIVGTRSEIMTRELEKFDPYSASVTVIDENHRMIHDGAYFELWRADATLGIGGVVDLLLAVPALTFPHLQDITLEASDAPVVLEMYEDTVTSADGTALPVFNKNRNSSNTPDTVVSVAPTITGVGTQIKRAAITSPAGSSIVFSQTKSGEWVLKPDTKYLVRVTNNSGAVIDFNITIGFYEPPEVIIA